ncbi:BMC domain-containing protein [Maridesulfovibrio hydrothermalis]|uniref:Microcompartments protein n=1 Tax=Maridesulfovibrio hydrothermalis AM13 = DSM 14728 TaxID=1121451 RepID=L0RA19_9BACT|nr:BMC domain-containing protein [Maridesulfovibrio hydrothermalis]CCO23633.1 Microcompartments protein [Maridesulfovibrio hydrothermalis AM13 = DSM 14728]
MSSALGFIETKGLLAAIEGADAMLKAADVSLLEKHLVGGGLVTITVAGEVSAVEASVDAAVAAISLISADALFSHHVIARHYDELDRIITTCAPASGQDEAEAVVKAAPDLEDMSEQVEKCEPIVQPEPEAGSGEEPAKDVETAPAAKPATPAAAITPAYRISEFKKMKISKIRQIARNLDGIPLTHEEIKKATKKNLIEVIINITRQIEE